MRRFCNSNSIKKGVDEKILEAEVDEIIEELDKDSEITKANIVRGIRIVRMPEPNKLNFELVHLYIKLYYLNSLYILDVMRKNIINQL